MSVLISLEAMPNRIRALAEVVGAEGGLAKDELARRIVPGVNNLDQFDNLLRESVRLGVVINEKDTNLICLSEGLSTKKIRNRNQFISMCLDSLIPDDPNRKTGNEAFASALAWFLTRPTGPTLQVGGEFRVELSNDLEGDEIYELTNASRSSMLLYWAQTLGFAEWLGFKGKDYGIPDPTRAMTAALKLILEKKLQTPISTVIEKLGHKVPVFETGYIRSEVESRLKNQRDSNYISQSSSLALARLELNGAIKIDQLADAPTLLMVGIDSKQRPVSHITLLKG
jgi:hypothetical protein